MPNQDPITRFLDKEGRLRQWPRKQADQKLVLEFLAAKFEPGKSYGELEVNRILMLNHTFEDYIFLRRALVDARLLGRESDGSRYWRTG
jgi:hypothetical protein